MKYKCSGHFSLPFFPQVFLIGDFRCVTCVIRCYSCFAESPFTMQAYDTTVVYDNLRRPINRVDRRSAYQDRPRRGSETLRPLHNEDLGHLENNHHVPRAGRHKYCTAEGVVNGSLVQQQQDTGRDNSQALLTRNSRADQRQKRQHMDAIPIAEQRWQLSYC